MLVGYARVSKGTQDTQLQMDAFEQAKVDRIFWEKKSGVVTKPQLKAAIAQLEEGDVFVVWKIDRCSRNPRELLWLIDELRSKGCFFRSLTQPIDTCTPVGELIYSILASVARFEWWQIRERSVAGLVSAVRRGKKIGRPKSLTDDQEEEVMLLWLEGHSMKSLAKRYSVHMTAVRRVIYRLTCPDHPWLQPKRPVIGPLLDDIY